MITQRNCPTRTLAAAALLFATMSGSEPTDPARALLGRVDSPYPAAASAILDPRSRTGAQAMLNSEIPGPTDARSGWEIVDLASRALQGRVQGW